VAATPRNSAALGRMTPLLEGRPLEPVAKAYVCENNSCRRPVTTPEDLRMALERPA